MISGALRSINLLNLLFLLITLRYKSFKSDVANLPPSSGTKGLNSGGITGITFKIIHSGLFPETLKASTTFNLFANFFGLSSLVVSLISFLIDSLRSSRSSSSSKSLIASAPIPTLKLSAPYSFCASINSSSFKS